MISYQRKVNIFNDFIEKVHNMTREHFLDGTENQRDRAAASFLSGVHHRGLPSLWDLRSRMGNKNRVLGGFL